MSCTVRLVCVVEIDRLPMIGKLGGTDSRQNPKDQFPRQNRKNLPIRNDAFDRFAAQIWNQTTTIKPTAGGGKPTALHTAWVV